jgi:cell division protein FtsA
MPKSTLVSVIDVGTSKISTLIANFLPGQKPNLIGVGFSSSAGVRKGAIVNVEEASAAIKSSIDEASRSAGVEVSSAYVATSMSQVEIFPRWGSVRPNEPNLPIGYDDINMAVDASCPRDLSPEKYLMHIMPRLYVVDGLTGIRNPVGMHALKLDVESLSVVGSSTIIQNLIHAVRGSRVKVDGVIFSPLALGESVLSRDEKEIGVLSIEIGGGVTSVSAFQGGSLWNSAILPVGGQQFSSDLAIALNAPYDIAEDVKIRHGQANMDGIGDEQVEIEAFGDRRTVLVGRRELCRYLHDRAEELFKLARIKMEEFGFTNVPPAGIVLSGGGALMPGIERVARRIFSAPIRIGSPKGIDNLPSGMESPEYCSTIGALLWVVKNGDTIERDNMSIRFTNGPKKGNRSPIGWLRGLRKA